MQNICADGSCRGLPPVPEVSLATAWGSFKTFMLRDGSLDNMVPLAFLLGIMHQACSRRQSHHWCLYSELPGSWVPI